MSTAALRIVLRQHRVELVTFGLVSLLIAGAAAWLAWQLGSLDFARCLVAAPSEDCVRRTAEANRLIAFLPTLQGAGAAAPPLIGLFIGAPFLSRELERGTAVFAWTYGPSRHRWLIQRVVIFGVAVALFSLLIGVAIDAVYAASTPQVTLDRNVVDYQIRGPLLAARALFAFLLATLVGSVVARLLPSLLIGAAVVAVLLGGVVLGISGLNRADPVEDAGPGSVQVEFRYRDRDGTVLGADEAGAVDLQGEEFRARFEIVDLGIPGERSVFLAMREAVVYLFGAVVAGIGLLLIVARRRPY